MIFSSFSQPVSNFCFQIKRMLVNQRGFIVESLKRMAAASTADSSCQGPSEPPAAAGMTARKSAINAEERDRTIGRVVAVQPEQLPQLQTASDSSCHQLQLSTAVVGQQQLVTSCEIANKVSLKHWMKFFIWSLAASCLQCKAQLWPKNKTFKRQLKFEYNLR